RLISVSTFAIYTKHAYNGFGKRNNQILMHKFRYRLSYIRLCTQATAQYDLKPSYLFAIFIFYFWNKTDVVDKGKCRIFLTGRKTKLKLSSEIGADRISKEIFKETMGIRSYIKRFVGIDSGDAGRRHVSYRITTGFPNGDIIFR